ncbi:alpha/beta hydrolase [Desulfoluna sp.]|uniref:alpha/beta hydrolase n=1 Tax=Desulfoluna sp. TaxID=2045199 RepID=UPI002606F150|nr:alpha/beta hydrolase [Desulfoluna sp.]
MKHFVQINLLVLGLWLAVLQPGDALGADHSCLHQVRSFSSDHQLNNPFDEERINGEPFEFTQEYLKIPFIPDSGFRFLIRYTRWKPSAENANGKVIIYNHGLQSHRGWFNGTAEDFYDQGYTVYAFDRIGCGESTVIRGSMFERMLSDDEALTLPVARGDLRALFLLQDSVQKPRDRHQAPVRKSHIMRCSSQLIPAQKK